MNSLILLLFGICNVLLTAGTVPTSRPHTPEGFELNQEMDIFKELLRKQFKTAEVKVKELKETDCKKIRTCNNQKLLFTELMKAYGRNNGTFQSFLSKISPSLNTTKDSTKSNFLKT